MKYLAVVLILTSSIAFAGEVAPTQKNDPAQKAATVAQKAEAVQKSQAVQKGPICSDGQCARRPRLRLFFWR